MRKLIVLILASSIIAGCGAKKSASGGETPQPAAQTDNNAPPSTTTVTPTPATTTDDNAPLAPLNSNAPIVIPEGPITTDQVPLAYDPLKVSFDDNATGKRFTGAQSLEGLLYTSSSTDDLLAYLRTKNNSVSATQRQYNLKAAAQIISAKIASDSFSNDAIVTLKILEGEETKIYNLGSVVDSEAAQPMKVVREGTTGSQQISGTLKCIDFGGIAKDGCKNIVARLSIGTPGNTGIAYVIFRKSVADLVVELPDDSDLSENREYKRFVNLFVNTVNDEDTKNRFDNYTLTSFEVVNGRSGFQVEAKARNQQFVGFSGPLLAPEIGTTVKLPVSRLAQDADISSDLIRNDGVKYDIAKTIAEARLINNNGLGQIRLQLKMRKVGSAPQDKLNLVFLRKITPVVDLNDDLLK